MKKLFSALMVLLTLSACTFIPEPPYPLYVEVPSDDYINETFSSSLGVFESVETVGEYPWVIDHNTAKATSFDSANKIDNAAKSYLISEPIDFTNETQAYIEFNYIIQYAENNIADCHLLLMCDNYSGDASKATWVNIPYGAEPGKKTADGPDWNTFSKASVEVPGQFMGKSGVVVAFCYNIEEGKKSTTWEVKNFRLAKGAMSGESTGEKPIEAKPYTIPQAIEAHASGKEEYAIIKGYIVGVVDLSYDNCIFGKTTTIKTNVLIADDANERDKTKCIPVELTGEILAGVNLVDNDNYRREVTLTGKITTYFGVAGLKDVRSYELGEKVEEPEGDTPEFELPEGKNILSSGSFEVWNGEKPEGWAPENSKNPATIKQSNDAIEGSNSVIIEGVTGKNKLLYSEPLKLKAGTYNIVAYVKANGEDKGFYRLGYTKITAGTRIGDNQPQYGEAATAVTDNWTQVVYNFTLESDTEIALAILNNLNGKGASFLVDNVMLLTTDGGIVTE